MVFSLFEGRATRGFGAIAQRGICFKLSEEGALVNNRTYLIFVLKKTTAQKTGFYSIWGNLQ